MLRRLLSSRNKELEAQQEFMDKAIHDGAYRYAAAAQSMFAEFRQTHAGNLSGDWKAFDTAQEFLKHANEELRSLMLYRCAFLALSAASPQNHDASGLISQLSHACWQLLHFSRRSATENTASPTKPHDAQSDTPRNDTVLSGK